MFKYINDNPMFLSEKRKRVDIGEKVSKNYAAMAPRGRGIPALLFPHFFLFPSPSTWPQENGWGLPLDGECPGLKPLSWRKIPEVECLTIISFHGQKWSWISKSKNEIERKSCTLVPKSPNPQPKNFPCVAFLFKFHCESYVNKMSNQVTANSWCLGRTSCTPRVSRYTAGQQSWSFFSVGVMKDPEMYISLAVERHKNVIRFWCVCLVHQNLIRSNVAMYQYV